MAALCDIRGVRCGVVFDHRDFGEKRRARKRRRADLFCIPLRVNYGWRGAVARRAERKHNLSLRVAKDLRHGTARWEAGRGNGTKDRHDGERGDTRVRGADRATSSARRKKRLRMARFTFPLQTIQTTRPASRPVVDYGNNRR